MPALFAVTGLILIASVLWHAFETVILPRRVTRRFRLTGLFYRYPWRPWSAVARRMRSGRRPRDVPGVLRAALASPAYPSHVV
jgi:hypothetical protein